MGRYIMKKFIKIILLGIVALSLISCSGGGIGGSSASKKPKVEISVKDFGVMQLELEPEIAPITVENFLKLVNDGFYNGLTFHRVVKGFMIQGGDPTGNGDGGTGETIKGEFASNGVENNIKHERGVLSMARAMDPNSAGSQFFIMTTTSPHLDGQYAAFGKVTEGMATADKIVNARRDFRDKPLLPQKIKSIRVEG